MAPMRIVDAFTYFNERHLLELRLLVLRDYVDCFVISEMNCTHAGIHKGFVLEQHLGELPVSRERIIYVKVDDGPEVNATLEAERWKLEHWQREALARGIAQLDLDADDVVLVSDLDEIPDPRALSFAVAALQHYNTAVFCHLHRKFFINSLADNYSINQCWLGTVAIRAKNLAQTTPQALRRGGDFPRASFLWTCGRAGDACYIEPGGWHLTYFGGDGSANLKSQSIADGTMAHAADKFYVPGRTRHNWTVGRTPAVMEWFANIDATVLPTKAFSVGSLTYLPEPVVADPIRWEWLWWYDTPIDMAIPALESDDQ